MGQVLIERACERFRRELSEGDDERIQTTAKVDDVRLALRQIEQQLAARQSLRNLGRLAPFLDAADRLTKPIDVLCNGTPFLPYVWVGCSYILILKKRDAELRLLQAPLKLILQVSEGQAYRS